MKAFFRAALFFGLLSGGALFAQAETFRDVQLGDGISLEIPAHWHELPTEVRKNLQAFSQAVMDQAGMKETKTRKETRLAVNATPEPTGAMIRVSVSTPPGFRPNELAKITPGELQEMRKEVDQNLQKSASAGGFTIGQVDPLQIERIDGEQALVIAYTRSSLVDASTWKVRQYKIPRPKFLLEVTLSYRERDGALWIPILEKVKRSLRL